MIARLDQVESVCPCTNTHIDTQSVSSYFSIIACSDWKILSFLLVSFPMCADAQTANPLGRKLIRSRSLDESLDTRDRQRPSLLVPIEK
jgi:hypothetical protein